MNVVHKKSAINSESQVNDLRTAHVLKMSSIGKDPDTEGKNDEFSKWIRSNLPDPPEDQISVSRYLQLFHVQMLVRKRSDKSFVGTVVLFFFYFDNQMIGDISSLL